MDSTYRCNGNRIFAYALWLYTLSKLVVCGCALYFAYNLYQIKDTTFVWIFGFIAILYNPIIPVYLYKKELWMVVNIITAGIFFIKKDLEIKDD